MCRVTQRGFGLVSGTPRWAPPNRASHGVPPPPHSSAIGFRERPQRLRYRAWAQKPHPPPGPGIRSTIAEPGLPLSPTSNVHLTFRQRRLGLARATPDVRRFRSGGGQPPIRPRAHPQPRVPAGWARQRWERDVADIQWEPNRHAASVADRVGECASATSKAQRSGPPIDATEFASRGLSYPREHDHSAE